MFQMFAVRFVRPLAHTLESRPALRAACATAASTPSHLPVASRGPHLARIACALVLCILTRQGASAFNQPLSFNTSSVRNMLQMFWVCSARALSPQP